ncbi:MAG: phosphoenolpyruvate--protein phosphotransferase [Lachnospiraceae bacterium]|nr:phosphoenolpyruvate--protein phosphotransferase [Lachnospiraceae bacterium]
MLKGIACSHGIGIGNIVRLAGHEPEYHNTAVTDTQAEIRRLKNALERFEEDTLHLAEIVKEQIGPAEAQIILQQAIIASDPSILEEIETRILEGQCAEAAFATVCDMFCQMLDSKDDDLIRQRSSDVADVKNAVLRILLGVKEIDISQIPPGAVLIAKDLTPSMAAKIKKELVSGIVTEKGNTTSHTAILARALEIPAVLGVSHVTEFANANTIAVVDGDQGLVFINPDEEQLTAYRAKRETFLQKQAHWNQFLTKPTLTADGKGLELLCNIGASGDAQKVLANGGEGIGLLRTEFLFMDAAKMPDEEEQFEAYKHAVLSMKGRVVIIRTLDVGGDKDIPYLHLKSEANPFLGFRGIRYSLGNPETFRVQLRAILRASAFGKVKIMLPLVTCIEELRSVRSMIASLGEQLSEAGIRYDSNLEVGCMIETASASLIADLLAKESDFFSIGTNDLVQYTMSVDRGNPDIAYLYSAFQPSVLRSIRHIITCAAKAGIPVGMCGEAAADAMMIPLLLSFGLTEFSVNPSDVPRVRCILSGWTKVKADAIAGKIMEMKTVAEILTYLEKAIEK